MYLSVNFLAFCAKDWRLALIKVLTLYLISVSFSSIKRFVIIYLCIYLFRTVVSVAQLVARRTHDRKIVGSIPTNAVCFTVVR